MSGDKGWFTEHREPEGRDPYRLASECSSVGCFCPKLFAITDWHGWRNHGKVDSFPPWNSILFRSDHPLHWWELMVPSNLVHQISYYEFLIVSDDVFGSIPPSGIMESLIVIKEITSAQLWLSAAGGVKLKVTDSPFWWLWSNCYLGWSHFPYPWNAGPNLQLHPKHCFVWWETENFWLFYLVLYRCIS